MKVADRPSGVLSKSRKARNEGRFAGYRARRFSRDEAPPARRMTVPSRLAVTARIGMGELSVFLAPTTLAEARDIFGRHRTRYWWAYAIARADLDGLIESPGRTPQWVLTDAGAAAVADWLAKQDEGCAA
jgi:hypothetical protein